jgi:hypothetical protein
MSLKMLLDPLLVDDYLREHRVTEGAPVEAACIQLDGAPPSGHPAVMLVIELDGRKVIAKTTLRSLEAICIAMRIASGTPRDAP